MKRYKFYYEVKRDMECGQEIIEAESQEEAQKTFDEMVEGAPHDLVDQAECCTPDYYEIKVVEVKELDDKS